MLWIHCNTWEIRLFFTSMSSVGLRLFQLVILRRSMLCDVMCIYVMGFAFLLLCKERFFILLFYSFEWSKFRLAAFSKLNVLMKIDRNFRKINRKWRDHLNRLPNGHPKQNWECDDIDKWNEVEFVECEIEKFLVGSLNFD